MTATARQEAVGRRPDEAAALRRRFDLDDLVSQAMAVARREIAEEADARFEMAIDMRRARMQRIRPLGVAGSDHSPSDAAVVAVAEGLETAPALPAFDVEVGEEAPTATGRILQWQRKLLNLTTSNNLLSFREGKSVVKLL